MSEKQNNIELRSEKVRRIIGRIPNILIRIGIGVIGITVLLTLLLLFLLPYPTYIEEKIYLYSEPNYIIKKESGNGTIQYDSIRHINKDEEIYKIIQGYDTITLKSPIDGYIIFFCANNTSMLPEKAICKITPSIVQEIFGIVYIPQSKLNSVHMGKIVEVFIGSKRVDGIIDEIYPANESTDNQCVKIKLDVKSNKSDFVSEMRSTGNVKILVSNKPFLKRILNL